MATGYALILDDDTEYLDGAVVELSSGYDDGVIRGQIRIPSPKKPKKPQEG